MLFGSALPVIVGYAVVITLPSAGAVIATTGAVVSIVMVCVSVPFVYPGALIVTVAT